MNASDLAHLRPTPLLDFDHPAIEQLVRERGWRALPTHERIGATYDFVGPVAFNPTTLGDGGIFSRIRRH